MTYRYCEATSCFSGFSLDSWLPKLETGYHVFACCKFTASSLQLGSVAFGKCEYKIAYVCPLSRADFSGAISLSDCSVFWAIFLVKAVGTSCCLVLWEGDTLPGPSCSVTAEEKKQTFVICAFAESLHDLFE